MTTREDRVCPRCGETAKDQRFCSGCGINLAEQPELPSAEEYAARLRETQWLRSKGTSVLPDTIVESKPESAQKESKAHIDWRRGGVVKSAGDTMIVAGTRDQWLVRGRNALAAQGFKAVCASGTLFQITGKYRTLKIWGDVELTLVAEGPASTRINIQATAKVDSIYRVFNSPGQKMIDLVKQGMALDPDT